MWRSNIQPGPVPQEGILLTIELNLTDLQGPCFVDGESTHRLF